MRGRSWCTASTTDGQPVPPRMRGRILASRWRDVAMECSPRMWTIPEERTREPDWNYSAPRACGDDPIGIAAPPSGGVLAYAGTHPPARREYERGDGVLLAYAGTIPEASSSSHSTRPVPPRMRGRSSLKVSGLPYVKSAPRVCGDDPAPQLLAGPSFAVLPAYAGMIPRWTLLFRQSRGCSPRMRG